MSQCNVRPCETRYSTVAACSHQCGQIPETLKGNTAKLCKLQIGPNDRYVNDAKICQALGQMFSRIGIRTEVSTQPSSAFFKLANTRPSGVSVSYLAWSPAGGGEADVLSQTLQTFNAERNAGVWNYSGYSNPHLDALIDEYSLVIDDAERRALQAAAVKLAVEDFASLPIHDQSVVVATRKGIDYTTSPEELTDAMSAR